jgi:hypothetical protein
MFNFKERPYNLLLLTAILILIASFFTSGQILDIHLHDTMFVITIEYVFGAIIILLLLFWVFHLATKRLLFSKTLMWIHVIISAAASLFLVVFLYVEDRNKELAGMPRRYLDSKDWQMTRQHDYLAEGMTIAVLLLIAGFLIYFINLIMGLVKKLIMSTN